MTYALLFAFILSTIISLKIRRQKQLETRHTGKRYHTEPPPENVEKIAHYKQQIADYIKIYGLTEKELKQAETIQQRKKALNSLAMLDNKIFMLQQKIDKLESMTE
jgi:hypothetical protein